MKGKTGQYSFLPCNLAMKDLLKTKKLSLPTYFPLCPCPKGQELQGDNEELELYLGPDVQRVF